MTDAVAIPEETRILHKLSEFDIGDTILTLKDTNVLNEEGTELNELPDELEHADKAAEDRRKWVKQSSKKAYDVYASLLGDKQDLLPQYNDENLEYHRSSYSLKEEQERHNATQREREDEDEAPNSAMAVDDAPSATLQSIRDKLSQALNQVKSNDHAKEYYSLDTGVGVKFQREYMTREEEESTFKKPKKRKSLRKKTQATEIVTDASAWDVPEEVDSSTQNHGSRKSRTTYLERDAEKAVEQLREKRQAYEVAKKKAEESRRMVVELAEKTLQTPEIEEEVEEEEGPLGHLVFDPTAEFCRGLQRQTEDNVGKAEKAKKKRDEDEEQKRVELEAIIKARQEQARKAREEVEKASGQRRNYRGKRKLTRPEEDPLGDTFEEVVGGMEVCEEPRVSAGLRATMDLIREKGLVVAEYSGRANDRIIDLKASDPAPGILLERPDNSGKDMTQKQAFRILSHHFHGKCPGKNKTEKKRRKDAEYARFRAMEATDTPLHSVEAMQQLQQRSKSAHVLIQGGVSDHSKERAAAGANAERKDKRSRDDGAAGSESVYAKRPRR